MNRSEYVVNLEGEGMLSQSGEHQTDARDVERIFRQLIPESGLSNVVVHFHGGLVDESAGLATADRLAPGYREKGNAWPLHVVWETGFFEILHPALLDLLADKTFFSRMLRWGLEKFSGQFLQSAGEDPIAAVDAIDIEAIEDVDLNPDVFQALDDGRLLHSLATGMQMDDDLTGMLSEILDGAGVTDTQSFDGDWPEVPEFAEGSEEVHYVSRDFVERLSGARGEAPEEEVELQLLGITTVVWQAARTMVRVGRRVCQRHRDGLAWHGFRETLVEELIREIFVLDMFGKKIWGRMKLNAEAAYVDTAGGTVLVDHLARWLDEDPARRLTIVGHSAGSIHAGHMIDRLARTSQRSQPVHQVIFLAPACDHEFFNTCIAAKRDRIGRFRMFTMDEEHEEKDQLLRPVYQHSLLFLISGILEQERAWPLFGMARWFDALPPDSTAFLQDQAHGVVLSPVRAGEPGLATASISHGDFDNERSTLDSVFHLLATD